MKEAGGIAVKAQCKHCKALMIGLVCIMIACWITTQWSNK